MVGPWGLEPQTSTVSTYHAYKRESAAEIEVAIEGHRCLPFIVVADKTTIKTRQRFAKMASDRKGNKES